MPALAPWLSLGPVSVERPASAGWTAVGALDPSTTARVDAAGLVDVPPAGWSLDWWIGADDRWHFPAREPAVRQRRIGSGPVVETALRIPSGDAVQRVWAARTGPAEVLVIEVENVSPAPVALALAIRPYDLDGRGGVSGFDRNDRAVRVDGRPVVWLPRPANQAAAVAGADLVDAIQAGEELKWSGPVADPDGRVAGVVVYPLPHRATIRVVIPLSDLASSTSSDSSSGRGTAPRAATTSRSGTTPGPVSMPETGTTSHQGTTLGAGSMPLAPADVADHATVARGWDTLVESGARVVLPDPMLTERAGRFRARLLLAASALPGQVVDGDPGATVRMAALAASGHGGEAVPAATELVAAWEDDALPSLAAVEAVGALGVVGGLADDRAVEPGFTETLVGMTRRLDRWRSRRAARPALAALAAHSRRVGQDQAVEVLISRAGPSGADPWAWLPAPTLEELSEQLADVSGAGAFPQDDPTRAALAWLGIRRAVVQERDDALALFPAFPTAWRGGAAEVHGLPTLYGRLSFAVRWHGYRPALLWELARRPGDRVVPLTCLGLDPDWSSTESAGEVLLAGTPDGLAPVPSEGDSFS